MKPTFWGFQMKHYLMRLNDPGWLREAYHLGLRHSYRRHSHQNLYLVGDHNLGWSNTWKFGLKMWSLFWKPIKIRAKKLFTFIQFQWLKIRAHRAKYNLKKSISSLFVFAFDSSYMKCRDSFSNMVFSNTNFQFIWF